ncbi:two component, sigma54 specific, transcriptional regulator, Fis family [Caldithrix abyssi DSM 13497]|uniref:Two component, sigma54 specific, transcriptional regulator, Fis family n=1 Tax=Caldithrix abyssi DSM 13497 TaxID=880073 RepID=H1XRJ3_CALAY|nr:sigma-54 dependent transcriptional regulator [Caldithrix abyssi]APF20072.1 two-component system, NtrC family, response regulator [Caldithrix abyssi DSM 13497]EHO40146.1 two component, sigma54 specific, transcriptional regulator, Fis family [Caldithrix abyssi DSM 13497]
MKALLVDDDINLTKVLSYQLKQSGYSVSVAHSGKEGLKLFKEQIFPLVISDIQMPDINGIQLLEEIRKIDRDAIFILITAFGSIDQAVRACELGADDYLTKPFSREQLIFTIEKAVKIHRLENENLLLKQELGQHFNFDNLIVQSPAMEKVVQVASRLAQSDSNVLILGESGTGKNLIAKAIHYNSRRKDKPLITVNCPSIPDQLLESELFGHVKGSYTGAISDRRGKFELADGGTIFLDEIGDLKPELQAKLLRVIQEKEFERIGENKPIKVDVRIISATNRDLKKLVEENRFREDLYYRLSVVPIVIPPLRERTEEIPALIDMMLKKLAPDRKIRITPRALSRLQTYHWPGNVRELENIIEQMVVLSGKDVLDEEDLPESLRQSASADAERWDSGEILPLRQLEKQAIERALQMADGNQSQAARLLEIPRHVLIYKMKKFDLLK